MRINPQDVLAKKEDILVYTKKEILQILKDNLPTVEEYVSRRSDLPFSKYVTLALEHGYGNYRVCSAYDIHKLKLSKSLSYYVKNFINDNGVFLVILNELSGKPISAVMRSLENKDFVDFSIYNCPYGLDLIRDDFKYGDYLIITEGLYDADSFRTIYTDIVGVMTSTVSVMYAEILNTVTDRFILAFDSDNAGQRGFVKAQERLLRLNPLAQVSKLFIYSGDKDLGDTRDIRSTSMGEGVDWEYRNRVDFYTNSIKILTG